MVEVFVAGNRVGTWAEAQSIVPDLAVKKQEIEIRDETGRTLGWFVPADPFPDDAELERRFAEGGGIPLADFWTKMGVE
jgi:hypothetical protein